MANTYSGHNNSGSLVPYNGLSSQSTEVDAAQRAVEILTRPVRYSAKTPIELAPPDPPQELLRILRLPEVVNRVGLKRAAIYHHIAKGSFPKQIALSDRAVGWVEQEINAWIAARINAGPKQKN